MLHDADREWAQARTESEVLRHRQRILALALLASLLLWQVPYGGVVLYPFKLLATWLHEISHGLVMLVAGAGFDRMELYRDTSGLAFATRGVDRAGRAAIAAAGYMGTPLFGALMLVLGRSDRGARRVLGALGMAMLLSAAIWVRNDFGLAAVSVAAVAVLSVVGFARPALVGWLLGFAAAQSCLNALLDIRVLFRSNLVVNGEVMGASDAHNMAAATVGTPAIWAALWLLWSLALFYGAMRLLPARQDASGALAVSGFPRDAARPRPATAPKQGASRRASR